MDSLYICLGPSCPLVMEYHQTCDTCIGPERFLYSDIWPGKLRSHELQTKFCRCMLMIRLSLSGRHSRNRSWSTRLDYIPHMEESSHYRRVYNGSAKRLLGRASVRGGGTWRSSPIHIRPGSGECFGCYWCRELRCFFRASHVTNR